MNPLTLIIGNKNYSSWSLRAWFFLKQGGVPFREIRVPLDAPDTRAQLARHSPSGRVPVLVDGDLTVWDSLAICEYVAERFPETDAWPHDIAVRAEARSVSAEMHSGFQALRAEMPMNCRARRKGVPASQAAAADIHRINAVWEDCRSRHGAGGPWLFGRISIADAMYVPVASRFQTYGVALGGAAAMYANALLTHPAFVEWSDAAQAEKEAIVSDERGTPVTASD